MQLPLLKKIDILRELQDDMRYCIFDKNTPISNQLDELFDLVNTMPSAVLDIENKLNLIKQKINKGRNDE